MFLAFSFSAGDPFVLEISRGWVDCFLVPVSVLLCVCGCGSVLRALSKC